MRSTGAMGVWGELQGPANVDLKHPEKLIRLTPGVVAVEPTPPNDAAHNRESSSLGRRDKRAAIDMLCIRELLKRNGNDMRWANSAKMFANGLTQIRAAWQIARFLSSGQIYIRPEPPQR